MPGVSIPHRPRGRLSYSFAGDAGDENPAPDAVVRRRLLDLPVGLVEDVQGESAGLARRAEAFSPAVQVCLPYRGLFVWHVGDDDVVGDATQVIFVTAGESYRLSSPLPCGFAELIITPDHGVLAELVPAVQAGRPPLATRTRRPRRSWRASPRLQSFGAQFRHWATSAPEDVLEAEEVVLALLRAVLTDAVAVPGPTTCGPTTRRLIRRTQEFLAAEYTQRISLSDVGRAVGVSPTYLTDVFRRVEGVSLHQYRTRLRLGRALTDLPQADDLTTLALDLGFASHSHFSAVFRRAFGVTPSAFRERTRRGACPWPPEPPT